MNIQLIQEIITYIIIAGAVFVAFHKIIIALSGRNEGKSSCSTECSGCSAVDMKKKYSSSHIIQK